MQLFSDWLTMNNSSSSLSGRFKELQGLHMALRPWLAHTWADVKKVNLHSAETFSVPSKGLMIPGIASPKDRWSIRCEKL